VSLKRDTLFIIKAPFEDAALDGAWYCHECAALEGALLANPHWALAIDVVRLVFPRPRREIIALIGDENQSMPVLVLASDSTPTDEAKVAAESGLSFLDNARAIGRYLVQAHGGAGPHP
jgi:hypothetical protein